MAITFFLFVLVIQFHRKKNLCLQTSEERAGWGEKSINLSTLWLFRISYADAFEKYKTQEETKNDFLYPERITSIIAWHNLRSSTVINSIIRHLLFAFALVAFHFR